MRHLQDMTHEQQMQFMADSYKAKLEANKGSNYEYWSEKHDALIECGEYDLYGFEMGGSLRQAIRVHYIAKEAVDRLRSEGFFARIICGYEKTRQRSKMYSVIFKKRK